MAGAVSTAIYPRLSEAMRLREQGRDDQAAKLLIAHLREHLPDAIEINHRDEHALLALQGPKAFDALKRHVTGKWPLDALVFMRGGPFEIGGVAFEIVQTFNG